MASSLPPIPPIRVVLPDGQELRGRLHARAPPPTPAEGPTAQVACEECGADVALGPLR